MGLHGNASGVVCITLEAVISVATVENLKLHNQAQQHYHPLPNFSLVNEVVIIYTRASGDFYLRWLPLDFLFF